MSLLLAYEFQCDKSLLALFSFNHVRTVLQGKLVPLVGAKDLQSTSAYDC